MGIISHIYLWPLEAVHEAKATVSPNMEIFVLEDVGLGDVVHIG